MKLNEIARATPVSKSERGYKEKLKNVEELGSGMYASAFSTQVHAGTVQKVGRVSVFRKTPDKDPYLLYVQVAQRHQNNPYFPKIYKVKIFQKTPNVDPTEYKRTGREPSRHPEYYYRVEMERLHDIRRLSIEQLIAIFEKIFGRVPTKKEAKYIGEIGISFFVTLIDKASRESEAWTKSTEASELRLSIVDSHLKQATQLLQNLQRKNPDIARDIHLSNIMCRMGPTGPQLVITDPFC